MQAFKATVRYLKETVIGDTHLDGPNEVEKLLNAVWEQQDEVERVVVLPYQNGFDRIEIDLPGHPDRMPGVSNILTIIRPAGGVHIMLYLKGKRIKPLHIYLEPLLDLRTALEVASYAV